MTDAQPEQPIEPAPPAYQPPTQVYGPTPAPLVPAPAKKSKKRFIVPAATLVVGMLLTGVPLAIANGQTRANCAEALDHANESISIAADSMGIMADALSFQGLSTAASKLESKTDDIKELKPKYVAASLKCLGK